MGKTIELVRQEVAAMRGEVEDFANSAERVGGVVSDVLEYGHEQLTDGKNKHDALAERVTVAEEAISDEVARAKSAEGALDGRITEVQQGSNAAIEALAQYAGEIDGKVTEETERAQAAELENRQAIEAEVTRAQGAEAANDKAIGDEVARAQEAEASLTEDIGVISGDLEKEIQRAQAAEQAIGTEITEAENRVDERVTEVRDNLEAEVQARSVAISDLNANTGISEYPAFDPAVDYAVGDVVKYEGRLYRFTADHAQGEWIGTDAEKWSERKEREERVTEIEYTVGDIYFELNEEITKRVVFDAGGVYYSKSIWSLKPVKNATYSFRLTFNQSLQSPIYIQFYDTNGVLTTDKKSFTIESGAELYEFDWNPKTEHEIVFIKYGTSVNIAATLSVSSDLPKYDDVKNSAILLPTLDCGVTNVTFNKTDKGYDVVLNSSNIYCVKKGKEYSAFGVSGTYSFDDTSAFLIYNILSKEVSISTSNVFGDYDVILLHYISSIKQFVAGYMYADFMNSFVEKTVYDTGASNVIFEKREDSGYNVIFNSNVYSSTLNSENNAYGINETFEFTSASKKLIYNYVTKTIYIGEKVQDDKEVVLLQYIANPVYSFVSGTLYSDFCRWQSNKYTDENILPKDKLSGFRLIHHLNVEIDSDNTYIPSQSLYDIAHAKKLGFEYIEANVQKCADGVYLVKHGSSGALGKGLKFVDGSGISETTLFSDITSESLRNNVTYDSIIPYYCGKIPTLEEFCAECQNKGMKVLLQCKLGRDILNIARKYLSDDCIIAYDLSERGDFRGAIFEWYSDEDKADATRAVGRGDYFGAPYIYACQTSVLNDEEISTLSHELHKRGYKFGSAYLNANEVLRAFSLGVDMVSSVYYQINEFDSVNKYLIDSIQDERLVVESGERTSAGVLKASTDGKCKLVFTDSSLASKIYRVSFEILYNGTLSISCGLQDASNTHGLLQIQNDGSRYVSGSFVCYNTDKVIMIFADKQSQIFDLCVKVSL